MGVQNSWVATITAHLAITLSCDEDSTLNQSTFLNTNVKGPCESEICHRAGRKLDVEDW